MINKELFFILAAFIFLPANVQANVNDDKRNVTNTGKSYFQTLDSHGHPVFSDKRPQTNVYQQLPLKEVNTLEWKATPKSLLKKRHSKTKRQKPQTKAPTKFSKSPCKKLKQQISRQQKHLTNRLKAEEFDKTKNQLSNSRHEYRRRCA